MKKLLLFVSMFTLVAFAQSSVVLTGSAQPPLPFNIIPQPGFENRTTGWSVTGGSFTTTSVTSLVARGRYSGQWTPPASMGAGVVLQSDAVAMPPGLYGHDCRGQMLYKGAAATDGAMSFEAFDGTNILGAVNLSDQTGYVYIQTSTFTCPSSGTLRMRIRNTSTIPSSPTVLYFDEAIIADVIALNLGSSITGLGTFGTSPSNQGATLSGVTLTMQPADATHPGGVSIASQSFAGAKTFTSNPIFSALGTGVIKSTSGALSVGGVLVDSDVSASAAIDASKLANGSVSNTEYQYLDGLTGNIQSQINAAIGSGFISSLTGDVTATGPGASVASVAAVGGSTAANVHSAELLANAAASSNTINAIVKRDGSGNFSAGTISAALAGNASTSTALAANPTDCSAGQKATAIDASGNLTCSAVSLTADVSGNLPVTNLNSGTSASSSTFWRGDGTWATPAGAGTVTSVDFSVPASSILSISGNPITGSGTLALATTGTSGGVPYFSSTSKLSSSALLTANALMLGGGAGAAPTVLGSLGNTTTVLHGNAGGAPSFGAIALSTDVSGQLPLANGGTNGTSATTGFNNLSPVTTRGDIIVRDATNNVRLAVGAAGTILRSNGTDPSWAYPVVNAQTSNYSAVVNDDTISGATAGGAFTVTLPTAVGISGKTFEICKSDSSANLLTVATTSSQTLGPSGPTTMKLHQIGVCEKFRSDNANWIIETQPDRAERAIINITGASACSITSQSGTWLTSPTATSSVCTMTIPTGIFSATPTCSCTGQPASTNTTVCRLTNGTNSTTLIVKAFDSTLGTALNEPVNVICRGPK